MRTQLRILTVISTLLLGHGLTACTTARGPITSPAELEVAKAQQANAGFLALTLDVRQVEPNTQGQLELTLVETKTRASQQVAIDLRSLSTEQRKQRQPIVFSLPPGTYAIDSAIFAVDGRPLQSGYLEPKWLRFNELKKSAPAEVVAGELRHIGFLEVEYTFATQGHTVHFEWAYKLRDQHPEPKDWASFAPAFAKYKAMYVGRMGRLVPWSLEAE